MIRQWKSTGAETLFEHPILSLRKHRLEAGEDVRAAYVVHTPDWVNLIPLLDDGRVLLVRQWRYGILQETLELPGGAVDPGEDEKTGAGRELFEETGYQAGTLRRLGEVHPNPAIQSNRTSTWVATDLEHIGDPTGDGEEELEVEAVPLVEIPRLIATGRITHTLVISAFYLYGLEGSGESGAL